MCASALCRISVLPIKDDLPKLKDFPAAIGGVRRDNARIATPSCTAGPRLFLDRMAGWILSRALANRPTNCWFVLFLDKEIITRLRSSRLVAISKPLARSFTMVTRTTRDDRTLRRLESQIQVPETQSAFHPRAQRNAFRRRDVRLQSRSFARWNQSLRRSPNSNRLC